MHALAAVRREIGSHDPIGKSKYLREFTAAFRQYDAVLSPEQFQQRISDADILLIGDYHALPASQRFTADLLENCSRQRPIVLAVEAILARDQKILDAWWRREISADELKQRLRFDREWGYPWEPFYEILSAARDCAEGVYGLDCVPRADLRRIRSRDRHAAEKIFEIRQHHPKATILVLFGESHMSPQHLPSRVRELLPQEKGLVVLQNVDALYWQAASEQSTALREGAVAIGEDAVCVFNSSPLEKYEGYRLCLERWRATNNEQQDFTPAVYNLIFSLARALGFRLDSPSNGRQPKFLADSLPEVVYVNDHSTGASANLQEKSCLYCSQSNSFLIRSFEIAEASEQCGRFLHFACRGMTEISPTARPVENALAQFSMRLLLPENQPHIPASTAGDSLYEAYVRNKASQSAIRRLFLAHLETRNQADGAIGLLNELTRA
jgi:Haem-binding uptake, Tiki superfamily, ChaN